MLWLYNLAQQALCLQIQVKGIRCLFQDLMDTMESMKKAVRVLESEAISAQSDDMQHLYTVCTMYRPSSMCSGSNEHFAGTCL